MSRLKKDLGQNFLTNNTVALNMINALSISEQGETDNILEIGPGKSVLTKLISEKLPKNAKLTAVEFDAKLAATLTNQFADFQNIKVLNQDILSYDYVEHNKVIGSLPYYITTPILRQFARADLDVGVFLVQKEVAQKICNTIPNSTSIATFVQTFYVCEIIENVDRKNFDPMPTVDSAVIKLTKKTNIWITREALNKYEKFLNKGYSNPRKMLNKTFTQEELTKAKIDSNLRPQNLGVEDWIKLFDSVYPGSHTSH